MAGLGCVAAGDGDEIVAVSSDVTITNSTTETALATLNIPAYMARAGTTYAYKLWGNNDNDASARVITFRIRVGGTGGTQILSQAITTTAGALANKSWYAQGTLMYRAVGTTTATTFKADMRLRDTIVSATSDNITDSGVTAVAGAAASDYTAARSLVITATWTTTAATCITRCFGGFIELVRV